MALHQVVLALFYAIGTRVRALVLCPGLHVVLDVSSRTDDDVYGAQDDAAAEGN